MASYGTLPSGERGERGSTRIGVRAVMAAAAFLAVSAVVAVVTLSGQEGTVRGPVRSHPSQEKGMQPRVGGASANRRCAGGRYRVWH